MKMKLKTEFNKLNFSNDNCYNCSNCNKQFAEELWCKECDPYGIIEGWTSGNPDIDKFIKDTIYEINAEKFGIPLEWVPFDKFTNIKQIGEGGFAKVYTATWIDGVSCFQEQNDDGSWKKRGPKPMEVALKRLNGSQNMSAEFLYEVQYILFFFNLIVIKIFFNFKFDK